MIAQTAEVSPSAPAVASLVAGTARVNGQQNLLSVCSLTTTPDNPTRLNLMKVLKVHRRIHQALEVRGSRGIPAPSARRATGL